MTHCERIPLAAAGEEGIKERMKTGQLGGCCSGPGKRQLVTWTTAVVLEVKRLEICR